MANALVGLSFFHVMKCLLSRVKVLVVIFLLSIPVFGETFRRSLERVASMDPLRAAAVYDSQAVMLVYEPLLGVDYYAKPYKLIPGLCELPVVSEDGKVYTFTLRDGVRFHDDECFGGGKGRVVTADDVVYTLKRLGDKNNASSGMWTVDSVEKVEALDARRVRITLKTPLHIFPWLMAMAYTGVVPHEAVEKYGSKFGGHPVGSGAYRLASWRRNHEMVFERNKAWHGWKNKSDSFARGTNGNYFDTVRYFVVDDLSTQWLLFLSGGIDYLSNIPRDNWDAVADQDGNILPEMANQGVALHSHPTLTVMYMGINMDDPVLGKNKKLRQALNCAFDFASWQKFFNGRILPSDGPVPDGVEGRIETKFDYSFDLEKAKKLLAEAGYPNGIDPKTGRRLVIPLALGRATQDAREQAELLQAFYARIGISLETQYMTWDTFLKTVNEGRVSLYFMGWVGDYPDAENFLQLFHSKNVSPGANHSNYRNKEFDEIYDAAMKTSSAEERNKYWLRAQEIIREDCPWVFLHIPKACSLLRTRIEGYTPTDFPYGMEKHLRARK